MILGSKHDARDGGGDHKSKRPGNRPHQSGKPFTLKYRPRSRHESEQGKSRLQPWNGGELLGNLLLMTKDIAAISSRPTIRRATLVPARKFLHYCAYTGADCLKD